MFTSFFDSNGIRPSAVCRVQRQKLAFFHDPEKIDRIRSDMSGDRRWGLGLGTPRNEVLSNSHGAPIAPEIPMRGARCSRFTGAVAINSLSKRTGDRLPREECLRLVWYQPSIHSKIASFASTCVRKLRRSSSSHSSVAKNDSAMALSYASPTEPTDGMTPISRQRLPKVKLVYCVP